MAPNLTVDDLSIPHPTQVFNRWVEDGTYRMLPVKFILEGNIAEAQHLTHQGAQLLNQMRRVNAFDLPQYNMAMDLPKGQRIRCNTNFGQETVWIYVPMVAGGVPLQKEKRTSQIIPAFEVTDVNGVELGWVLCLSGTWEPAYEFVSKKRANKELDLFEWGNWPAHYSEKPFTGIRDNKLFISESSNANTKTYKLTDLAAHGESLCDLSTTSDGWATSEFGGDQHWELTACDDGCALWATATINYNTTSIYSSVVQNNGSSLSLTQCTRTGVLSGSPKIYGYRVGAGIVNGMSGDCTILTNYMNANPAPTPVGDPPTYNSNSKITGTMDYILNGCQTGFDSVWSTVASTGGLGLVFSASDRSLIQSGWKNTPACNPANYTTGGMWGNFGNLAEASINSQEQVLVDNEVFDTIPARYTPDATGDVDAPITVYPRYYEVGNSIYFLVSICRDSDTYGNRWQYGIYRSFVTGQNRWLFNVEFPIEGDGPSYSHKLTGVTVGGNPVYCTGKFRLIRKETYEAILEA